MLSLCELSVPFTHVRACANTASYIPVHTTCPVSIGGLVERVVGSGTPGAAAAFGNVESRLVSALCCLYVEVAFVPAACPLEHYPGVELVDLRLLDGFVPP